KENSELLQAYTRLSEDNRNLSAKYAEATFAIGQLEERVHHLTQQVIEGEAQLLKFELEPPTPKALPEPPPPPPPPPVQDDSAIRELEEQVRLLAMAVISS